MPGRIIAGSIAVLIAFSGHAFAQDAAAGEKVFAKCKACHVADKPVNRVGPSLMKLNGRTAGSLPDFKFSPTMIEAGQGGLVWNDETLTEYLRNPKAMVKGTRMVFVGLKKDEDIANVIAYINQFQ